MTSARFTVSHSPEHIRLPEGWRHTAYDEIDSTNTALRRMVEMGAQTEEGLVISAKSQTAGRGRDGRTWASPPGGLYCSTLILSPDNLANAPEIGFVAALALVAAIQSLLPDSAPDDALRCKWPNDILFNGAKVAGILLETASAPDTPKPFVILGVGLNLEPVEIDPPAIYPVTSLHEHGHFISRFQALEAFAKQLALFLGQWRREGFAPIRQAWLNRAAGYNQPIAVQLPQEKIEGRFVNLDADGALIVERTDGTRRRVIAGDLLLPGAE